MYESSRTEGDKTASQRSVVANGEKIRALRKQGGMTQEALAAKAGLSQKTIATAEKTRAVDLSTMTLIAGALGVGYADLTQPHGQPEAEKGEANEKAKGRHGTYVMAGIAVLAVLGVCTWFFLRERGIHQLLRGHLWVAYNPSEPVPQEDGPESQLGSAEATGRMEESIRKDLRVLLESTRFTGLITFGSDPRQAQIPSWAKEEGFDSVIMGVFIHPSSHDDNKLQMENAKAQTAADAYLVFYNHKQPPLDELHKYIHELQQATGKPVAARLDHAQYSKRGLTLLRIGDFDSPDVLGPWEPGRSAKESFEDLQQKVDLLAKIIPQDRPALLGMISLPTGPGDDFTEENQKLFLRMVLGRQFNLPPNMGFYFYDAFDPPVGAHQDRASSPEFHRGLFKNDRKPKLGIEELGRP